MTGFLVFRDASALLDVVSGWPLATLETVALARIPDATTLAQAVAIARAEFEQTPHVVMSYADAVDRVRALTLQRRAKHQHQQRGRAKR